MTKVPKTILKRGKLTIANHFRYLDSCFTKDGSSAIEVSSRRSKTSAALVASIWYFLEDHAYCASMLSVLLNSGCVMNIFVIRGGGVDYRCLHNVTRIGRLTAWAMLNLEIQYWVAVQRILFHSASSLVDFSGWVGCACQIHVYHTVTYFAFIPWSGRNHLEVNRC